MSLQQTTIVPLATAAPAAADAKSSDLAPSTGGTKFVVNHYDSGRYLLKVVTSIGGANSSTTGGGGMMGMSGLSA